MCINDLIKELEAFAPPVYQESYDNAGLITGNRGWDCTGVLCTLDCTEAVVMDAVAKNANLIVAHHPILFSGIKKLSGNGYVERALIAAIKNDIAIYAIHTNLDNVAKGVNNRIADKLGLEQRRVLVPKPGLICKLYTYAPASHADVVKEALYAAGAGKIGLYEECSFSTTGSGTFKPIAGAAPYIGTVGERETAEETKIEVIFPQYLQARVLKALTAAHPYEMVAYEVIKLENYHQDIGSGLLGVLPIETNEAIFLESIKNAFGTSCIRHTPLRGKPVKTVAICGGAGSFLTRAAIGAGADFYITADVKYHEFFDADGQIVLADIGHWESEQFTTELLAEFLKDKFPTFAVLKTEVNTNPVMYL